MKQKILVIRFSSIGDIVLTTPVIRALHQQLDAEVHYLTKPAFAPILHSNPYVAKVISLTEDSAGMLGALKAEHYDYVIDLHHNLRSQRIKLALGTSSKSFHKLNFQKWLMVRFGINRLPDIHVVDRYMETASALGVRNDGKGLDFFIPADKEVDISNVFGISPGKYVALVIGAAHQTKCLTAGQITKLCDRLDKPVILLGGKNEKEKADLIAQTTTSSNVRNACGGFDILQSASIVRQSGVVISPDTGLMHIAAALQKPLVAVWGNTIPEFGMYPYYGDKKTDWISVEEKELKCRPCSKLGFPECPKGHFKCMLNHDMDRIAMAADSLFGL